MNIQYTLYVLTHPFKKRVYVEPDGLDWIVNEKNFIQAFVDDSVAYGARVAWENLWNVLTIPPAKR